MLVSPDLLWCHHHLVDICRISVEIPCLCHIGAWSRPEMKLCASQTAHLPPQFIPFQESVHIFNLWLFINYRCSFLSISMTRVGSQRKNPSGFQQEHTGSTDRQITLSLTLFVSQVGTRVICFIFHQMWKAGGKYFLMKRHLSTYGLLCWLAKLDSSSLNSTIPEKMSVKSLCFLNREKTDWSVFPSCF